MLLLTNTSGYNLNGPKEVTRTLAVTHQRGLHLRPCSAIGGLEDANQGRNRRAGELEAAT